jgi:hypothetical protein
MTEISFIMIQWNRSFLMGLNNYTTAKDRIFLSNQLMKLSLLNHRKLARFKFAVEQRKQKTKFRLQKETTKWKIRNKEPYLLEKLIIKTINHTKNM